MKIILLINSLSTGGAEFSTLSFYSWLREKTNSEIKIVCLKKADPEYDFKEFGFETINYLNGSSFPARLKSFNLIVEQFKPEIVHSVLFDANLLGRISRLMKRNFKHVESLVNQTYSPYRLNDPNITPFKLQAYRFLDYTTQVFGVDHFHSNGQTVADHYSEKLHISPSRITVIPRGRYPNPYMGDKIVRDKLRGKLNLNNKVQIINVARHEYQKAQTVLLDALWELDDLKDQYILFLVGRKGEATVEITEKIKTYHLEENVRILGHRDDVPALLASSDIFIFPSRFEGLPGALIEAEAAGLPIICSDIANNLEVVEENKNALIFPVNNSDILSKQLKELILNSEQRKNMGQESLSIYQNKFTIEEVHQKMYVLFKALINSDLIP